MQYHKDSNCSQFVWYAATTARRKASSTERSLQKPQSEAYISNSLVQTLYQLHYYLLLYSQALSNDSPALSNYVCSRHFG